MQVSDSSLIALLPRNPGGIRVVFRVSLHVVNLARRLLKRNGYHKVDLRSMPGPSRASFFFAYLCIQAYTNGTG